MNLDLILPIYNEKDNLRSLINEIDEELSGSGTTYRVILVDDGSTDGSTELIRDLTEENESVSSIHFRNNQGQSAAFAAGFDAATSPYVVTMDADGQNDPAEIPGMLEEIEEYDVVAGYRANRKDHWIRLAASKIANSFRNWITGDEIIDTGCSLKVFKKEVVKDIPMFEGMHRFLPTLAKMEGYSVTQHPTNHRPRQGGETKYSISGRLGKTIWDLLAVRWMQKRNIDYEVEEFRDS